MAASSLVSVANGWRGFGYGYGYLITANKEREVKQGKNYYMSTLCQLPQLAILGALVQEVAKCLSWTSKPLAMACGLGPLLYVPVGLFAAAVKQGHYGEMRTKVVTYLPSLQYVLPKQLSHRTIKVLSFFAEHTGQLARVGMIAGSIALICLEQYATGGVMLGIFIYRELDLRGYVPFKASLFVETYAPMISSVSLMFFGASLSIQLFSAMEVASLIFSPAKLFIAYTVDGLFRGVIRLGIGLIARRLSPAAAAELKAEVRQFLGSSLAEYDAPICPQKNMTAAQIQQILDAKDRDYEVDPAHCSKWAAGEHALPEDHQFEGLLRQFEQIAWDKEYGLVSAKLRDDEQFRDFLISQFPAATEKSLRNKAQFDACVVELAQKIGKSKEQYLAEWIRAQMVQLVKVLKTDVPVQGAKEDLVTAQSSCAKILAYLKALKSDDVEREDILLKLAVEAGNFCARGIKRASAEIVDLTIIPKGLPMSQIQADSDLQRSYEISILAALQNQRLIHMQQMYQLITGMSLAPKAMAQDVHTFDIYRKILSLGFYPMTQLERQSQDIDEVIRWPFFFAYRDAMLNGRPNFDPADMEGVVKGYSSTLFEAVQQTIQQKGVTAFVAYMRAVLGANKQLTATEKEALEEQLIADASAAQLLPNGTLAKEILFPRFRRLMLVMMGVLRPKTVTL